MSTHNSTSLDGSGYETIYSSISQNIFHISKCLAYIAAEKTLQLKTTKKEWI